MVRVEKDSTIREVLRGIDVVERPPVALVPAAQKILDIIDKIENSGKKPTLSGIARGMRYDAADEIAKQPVVEATEAITKFGNELIHVEEIAGKSRTEIRIKVVGKELFGQLSKLVNAGYLAIQDEGKGENEKLVFRLTPEGKDQIEQFRKIPGVV